MPNLRDYAASIVEGDTIEAKLRPPPRDLDDEDRGAALRIKAPGRPRELLMVAGGRVKVPPAEGMGDPAQRARILHAFGSHELQAIELFAWAVLAFPDAPAAFRRGLLRILVEEQKHLSLYASRLAALNSGFGAHPVSGHFWNQIPAVETPLGFVSAMSLTFENANLDFSRAFAAAAEECGDAETAAVLREVHEDEIGHVAFGWRWLQGLKDPEAASWDVWVANLPPPIIPGRARGISFDPEARRRAGLSEEFIERLAGTAATRPGGFVR